MTATSAAHDVSMQASLPPAPATLEDTGLVPDTIEALLLKTLHGGEASGLAVADRLCLPYVLLDPLIEHARAERFVEVRGASGSGAASYRYALTDAGRDRARQHLDASHYVGPAPVTLAAYVAQMRSLAVTRGHLDRERLRRAFAHLVVNDAVLDQLGPAINAGRGVFLYGPPGNGKTVLGEGMGAALGGDMYIPYAIDVDGQIVTLFDPISHETLAPDDEGGSVVKTTPRDRRWVRIRRPVVVVGGELTLEMLDLTFNPIARFHEAPLQLKANGGVFLVDDFGRQRVRPEDLLNRWIVPLESRVDYLTLHTGKKFQVPFDVLIVFATNLNPAALADEAFMRRIPYKVAVDNPTNTEFARIFELNCRKKNLAFDPGMATYLQRRHYEPRGRPLRACHPRDLLDQVAALCRYRGVEPVLTRELLDEACASYFLDGEAAAGSAEPLPASPPAPMDVH